MTYLSYLLWPNPGVIGYSSATIRLLLVSVLALIVLSVLVRVWRSKTTNPVTKKLSRSWATALVWFALVLGFLTVSRAEGISYVSMRLWFFVWALLLVVYVVFQIKQYSARHYQVLPKERIDDPRDKYLPKKK